MVMVFSFGRLSSLPFWYVEFSTIKLVKLSKKYEMEFAREIKDLSVEQQKVVLEKSKIASKIFSSYNKTI